MNFRLRMQLAEALGHVNRWYCSQAHGYPVDDPDLLMCYFVRSGGAKDFARRYEEAMGPKIAGTVPRSTGVTFVIPKRSGPII